MNMKKYQGTKCVEAEPMTLGEYKQQSGRDPYANDPLTMPDDTEGYHVHYKDGYESWSPKKPFDEAYKPCETFLDRLYIELDELKDRRAKLEAFVNHNAKFAELGFDDRRLLRDQLYIMGEYERILTERISRIERKVQKE